MAMDFMMGRADGGAAAPPDLAAALGAGAPPQPQAGGDPESTYQSLIDSTDDVNTLVQWAKMAVAKAIGLEPDEQDKLVLEDINSRAQKYLATQQQTSDQAFGAGPGTKALRKAGYS